MERNSRTGIVFALVTLISAGCVGVNHEETGIMNGAGLGAVTGAVIGHQSNNAGVGALVGAGLGGLAGGIIGNKQDQIDQQNAMLASQQAASALTNYDIVQLSQNGMGDGVIIGAIQSRGGAFDLSPQSLISLKQQGVSEPVLEYMQQNSTAAPNQKTVIIQPVSQPDVVIAPSPVIAVEPHFYHRHHYRRRPRAGVHFHW